MMKRRYAYILIGSLLVAMATHAMEGPNNNRQLVPQISHFHHLPKEMIEIVFSFLDWNTLLKAKWVCRKWREIIKNNKDYILTQLSKESGNPELYRQYCFTKLSQPTTGYNYILDDIRLGFENLQELYESGALRDIFYGFDISPINTIDPAPLLEEARKSRPQIWSIRIGYPSVPLDVGHYLTMKNAEYFYINEDSQNLTGCLFEPRQSITEFITTKFAYLPPSLSLATQLKGISISLHHPSPNDKKQQFQVAGLHHLLKLTNLRILKINYGLKRIPSMLYSLFPVPEVDLSYNYLTSASFRIREANYDLRKLNLSHNRFTQIPPEIHLLKALKDLNLSYNFITEISFPRNHSLTDLNLSHNLIENIIPSSLTNLTGLRFLELDYNSIRTIPSEIGLLKSLYTLTIEHNKLKTLPPQIGSCIRLEELGIEGNPLEELPASVCNLRDCDLSLKFASLKLKTLPYGFRNYTLPNLNLSNNQFEDFPESIFFMSRLEILDLSYNNLSIIPFNIGKVTYLTDLNLKNNEIMELSNGIGGLQFLESLNLSWNQLRYLPPSIGDLPFLKTFNLAHNQLALLPSTFKNLEGLRDLNLNGNPFTDILTLRESLPAHLKSGEESLQFTSDAPYMAPVRPSPPPLPPLLPTPTAPQSSWGCELM